MLHSASRLTPEERNFASLLSDQGFVVFAPEYFDAEKVTRPINLGSILKDNIDGMREDAASGVYCLKSLGYADSNRIGTVGLSFGGYLATLLGTRADIRAVVSLSGAFYPSPLRIEIKYPYGYIVRQVQASVLIIHGDSDQTISVRDARSADKALSDNGKKSELVEFPKMDHLFAIKGYDTYNAQAAADALSRIVGFLREKLR